MKPVYLCGRGLVCGLGLDITESISVLRQGGVKPIFRCLPGHLGGHFPFYAIPDAQPDWNTRARDLVQRAVNEADPEQMRSGTLIIATSSFNIGAVEKDATNMDYVPFSNKVASWLQWSGPVYTISTACTSSLNALMTAHALLQTGEAEDVLVLGIELDNQLTLAGFAALQLLSTTGSQPFGAHRDGLVLGEAVAALKLSTRKQGHWKISGSANVVDGGQPTGASAHAVVAMYQQALASAGMTSEEIDLIKVQAAGSPGNDAAEAQGLREVFESVPPLISFKSAIGHSMGASGVAEIALLTACLEQDVWLSSTDEIDAELGVSLAPAMPQNVRRILATILGFGGSHASVILERV